MQATTTIPHNIYILNYKIKITRTQYNRNRTQTNYIMEAKLITTSTLYNTYIIYMNTTKLKHETNMYKRDATKPTPTMLH